MKQYRFPDTDNEGYEIIVPNEVVREVIHDYRVKTFYLSVSSLSLIVGLLLGILIS